MDFQAAPRGETRHLLSGGREVSPHGGRNGTGRKNHGKNVGKSGENRGKPWKKPWKMLFDVKIMGNSTK